MSEHQPSGSGQDTAPDQEKEHIPESPPPDPDEPLFTLPDMDHELSEADRPGDGGSADEEDDD